MGKISIERHLHFYYCPLIIDNWKEQSAEYKKLFDLLGRPYGYTGMNIFYTFFTIYWYHRIKGKEVRFYDRVLKAE